MRPIPLFVPFSIALFFTLFGTALLPKVHLITFSPFLVFIYHRSSFLKAIWLASLCGLIVDLSSSELRFGSYALNFCLVTALLYRFRRQFFEDKAISLFLFTALISLLSSLVHLMLAALWHKDLPFSLKDLLITPLFDATYALFAFSFPFLLHRIAKRKGWYKFKRRGMNA